MLIENIKSPSDIKALSLENLPILADEARKVLIDRLSVRGGHVGPNLGIVEATVALHRVFDCPTDKFIFDVSHQCYCHKMLTGRIDAYLYPEHYAEVTGFTNPEESPYDNFVVGHTSTSVSLALGMAKGRDVCGGTENVVAIIGDGSLSGGEAMEGLSNAGEYDGNLIIVVNDNQMSIAENHGGIYKNLQLLRDTNGTAELNWFKAQGLDYIYVAEGNNVLALTEAFQKVKGTKKPVVVHINTLKGKGLPFAEQHKEAWHYGQPFNIADGSPKYKGSGKESWNDINGEYLMAKAAQKPELVVLAAGTPGSLGMTPERRTKLGRQYVDTGIAEEHTVALASGIAARGGSPVFGTFSTFFQRVYDQMSQDVCVNHSPATFIVMGPSVYCMNDVTHICIFDIPLLSNIPGLVYLAPTCKEEYLAMFDWAVEQRQHSVAIRVPGTRVLYRPDATFPTDYGTLNISEVAHRGSKVALIGVGNFFDRAQQVAALLKAEGIDATVINPRYLTGLDTALLDSLKADHQIVVTLEDGSIDGGFGEKIARYYGDSDMKVLVRGIKKDLYDNYVAEELITANRLQPEQIVADVLNH